MKNNLLWDIKTFENLISYKTKVEYTRFEHILDVDYVSILIESEMNLEKAIDKFDKILRQVHKIGKGRSTTPRVLQEYSNKLVVVKREIEEQYVKLMTLDLSESLLITESSIIEVCKNRHIYRDKAKVLPTVKSDKKAQLEKLKGELENDEMILKLGEMKNSIYEEIVGIRTIVSEDTFDEKGEPLTYQIKGKKKIEFIPQYFQIVDRLRTYIYESTTNKATADDYLESQKLLEERIEIEKIEQAQKKEEFERKKI